MSREKVLLHNFQVPRIIFGKQQIMEIVEDVLIVGAGIAGLSTSLGLHRIGIGSLVLESSSSLRVTGFALGIWSNGWKALDALGIAQTLRQQHLKLEGLGLMPNVAGDPGKPGTGLSLNRKGKNGEHELRCVRRKLLLEALEKELPSGTIRYSSKVVSIEESGYYTLVHLADGTIIKTKVLIGCDGVNSVVAKWLGFKNAAFTGRSGIRACADFKTAHHDFGSRMEQIFGNGFRAGFLPCDESIVYWFFTWTPSAQEKEMEDNPAQLKQFVLRKLDNVPDQIRNFVEMTELDRMTCSPIRYRYPWELLWGNMSKGNVCVAGDALHPMTPDIAQGGCAALEDAVVLARCIGEALKKKKSSSVEMQERDEEEEEYKRIEVGLKKYASERRWRSFDLILTAYMVGAVQQSGGVVMTTLRDSIFSQFLAGLLLKKADFDCGKLSLS